MYACIYTVVIKKFSDPPKCLHNLKHYHKIFVEKSFCVLKGVTALDTNKYQYIFYYYYLLFLRKTSKTKFLTISRSQFSTLLVSSQQITCECVQN